MGKLVQEKQETRGTVARASVFWAILAVPFVIWKMFSKRNERKESFLDRLRRR